MLEQEKERKEAKRLYKSFLEPAISFKTIICIDKNNRFALKRICRLKRVGSYQNEQNNFVHIFRKGKKVYKLEIPQSYQSLLELKKSYYFVFAIKLKKKYLSIIEIVYLYF